MESLVKALPALGQVISSRVDVISCALLSSSVEKSELASHLIKASIWLQTLGASKPKQRLEKPTFPILRTDTTDRHPSYYLP